MEGKRLASRRSPGRHGRRRFPGLGPANDDHDESGTQAVLRAGSSGAGGVGVKEVKLHSAGLVESFTRRLSEAGFTLIREYDDPITGDAQWRFSSGAVDFEVGDDRDELYVTAGPAGVRGFGMITWAAVLGIQPPEYPDYNEEQLSRQLDFALSNLGKIRMAIEGNDRILDELRQVNRSIAVRRL